MKKWTLILIGIIILLIILIVIFNNYGGAPTIDNMSQFEVDRRKLWY